MERFEFIMILLKSPDQLKKLEYVNRLGIEFLDECYEYLKPGVLTVELEDLAYKFCERNRVKSAFYKYQDFPHMVCVSVNTEIIHGFPSTYSVKPGDLISVDFGVIKDGYVSDAAFTKIIGKTSEIAKKLVKTTRSALYEGINKARFGNRINDVSFAIQSCALRMGFDVTRDFVGHGVGFNLHEDPKIPNYVKKDAINWALKPGMALAIEPMFVEGSYEYKISPNGWTVFTLDNKLSAHFEHSIAILESGPIVLSKTSLW